MHHFSTIKTVDQPAGTGFSPTNNLKEQELYITGESFAGTYIPYFASRLLELNKKEHKNVSCF
jgi:carboxypeptidase D